VFVELRGDTDADAALRAMARVTGLSEVLIDGRVIRGRATVGAVALPHVLAVLDAEGLAVASATVARPSLDDVYLRHTGHSYSAASSANYSHANSEGAIA
jgi:ABC-2 type transport system ATP-binding protein